jgi:hypothetical protein
MLPRALVYDDRVAAEAKVCWAALQDAMRGAPAWIGTTSQLATLISLEERQARRLTRQLAEAGWLRIDPCGRRGNRYVLLGRARDVDLGVVDNPVHDGLGGWSEMSGQPRSTPVRNVRGHGVPTSIRAREQSTGQTELDLSTTDGAGGAARRPAWCGGCDRASRCVPVVDGGFSRVGIDGAWARCPACHPTMVPAF